MKITFSSIIPLILIAPLIFWEDDDIPGQKVIGTGILLDSMDNEVMLLMEDDQPQYYFSNIFTPVCNTGECLPVKVNFYWDLTGKYLKFDQPEGEILTKVDHAPFTQDDYNLLDEILKGADPRYGGMDIHSDSGVKHNKNDEQDNQAQPAPGSMTKLSKYEMVDGITGSTLPEIKDKFVPGALYTTYTLWGLANDHQSEMRRYTEAQLITEKHIPFLLSGNNVQHKEMVINALAAKENGDNGRAKVLISFLDTGNVKLQFLAMNQFYWNDIQLKEVQEMLHKKFYGEVDPEIKKQIVYKWAYNEMPVAYMIELSANIKDHEDVMNEIVALYKNKLQWPEDVFENLTAAMPKLTPENQVKLMALLKSHREYLSADQWKKVKTLEKKY